MAKSKSSKRSSPTFVSPGGKGMIGQQYAGPRKSGQVGNETTGNGGKWGAGGGKAMTGKKATPAKPA